MALLTDEEKKKIEEEEEARARIRLKFEPKSSGLAGVLSSILPGLGQVYNGQLWKASLCMVVVFISLVMLVAGVLFAARGMPARGDSLIFEESESLEISEEGIVMDPRAEAREERKERETQFPKTPVVLIVVGLIGVSLGRNYSIKDAIKTAKQINSSY